MKIAVTYQDGDIFQHFGHTEFFKIYDIENTDIVKTEIVSTNGSGHGALAQFLHEHSVDVVNFKEFGVSEVLKDVAVLISNCDFHCYTAPLL